MKLILGTAQFGMAYGITNYAQSKPTDAEVADILEYAYLNGINILDSAQEYGDANKRIAHFHALTKNKFAIINKILRFPVNSRKELLALKDKLSYELDELKIDHFDTLMLHYAYSVNNFITYDFLFGLVQEGIAKQLGLSINSTEEYDFLAPKFSFNVIQLPLNILNQNNFGSDFLCLLKDKGCQVHVRSIFLQGLLLAGSEKVPAYLLGIKPYISKIEKAAYDLKIPIRALCMAFALHNEFIDYIVSGVQTKQELVDLIDNYLIAEEFLATKPSIEWQKFACLNKEIIDPTQWNKLKYDYTKHIQI